MWLNILNVQHCVLAIARRGQKSTESPATCNVLPGQTLGHRAKGDGFDGGLDITRLPSLGLPGLMFEPQGNGGQSGRRVAQGLGLHDAGSQGDAVVHWALRITIDQRSPAAARSAGLAAWLTAGAVD